MMDSHDDNAVILNGITKRFGAKAAVDDLDLRIPTNSLCGFLGPNGAGKTTTIRMIMAIIFPDSGSLQVLGRKSAIESKDRIGYLPEERGVYRTMRVGDFLTYMARLKGAEHAGLSRRIDEWLERVALPDVRKKRCQELSKGMQQKVQFVATVIHDPELIILDEPFSGLDPVNARLLRELVQELHAQGKTIVFSTHVLPAAEQICQRVFMINRGKKVLDGTVAEIRADHDPRTLVVQPISANDADPSRYERVDGVVRAERGMAGTNTILEIHLSDGADAQQALRDVAAVAPARRVELRTATLEDVFVSLVKTGDSEDDLRRSLRADDAAAMEPEHARA
jgi:ABC-2 type transport system ATP-binding protein